MNFDLEFYWKLFIRRLPIMMLFLLSCVTISVITANKLPATWSTSARLLVEEPQIPNEMVAITVQVSPVEQLDIIRQKLTTRANLIDIANRFDVFENIRAMTPDEVVQEMRNHTRIRPSSGRNAATILEIGFTARSGPIATSVVNEYVSLALEENVEFRVTRAENTLNFFEQEVDRLGRDLDRQSSEIALFKSDHIDALPEDQTFRMGRQSLLQERLSRLEREKATLLKQRADVERIFKQTGRITAGGVPQFRSPQEEQLIVTRAELDRALSLYSESHPQVIRLQARVDRLEAIVAAQTQEAVGAEKPASPEELLFQAQLAELNGRLEFVETDLTDTMTELADLQVAIAESSANGIALSALQRDYENLQARYNAAVNNLNNARITERIETTAQGQRISVIESATTPEVPTGPDRTKIIAIGAALGLSLAAAYFMLLEILNSSVRRPAELIGRFDVTPIAVVPYMESYTHRLMRRGSIILAIVVVLVGVPLGLWYIDTNYLPLELVVEKGLARLGLG